VKYFYQIFWDFEQGRVVVEIFDLFYCLFVKKPINLAAF
jgi:hypothetical protein